MKIAQISDPHFGTIRDGLEETLRQALFAFNPDLVLITGDITQRARTAQFRSAKKFIDSLKPLTVFAVPGNHDIPLYNLPLRFLDPYRGFRRHFFRKTTNSITIDGVKVFALNSTDRWRHIQGELHEGLEIILNDSSADAPFKIAAFHHPMDCAKPGDEKNLLKNGEQALHVFNRAGIDLIVGGHIHDPFVNLSTTRYPQVPRSMVIAVAGTCLSWRTRSDSNNSFNQIEFDLTKGQPEMTIARMDLGDDHLFHAVEIKRFTRDLKRNWSTSTERNPHQ